MIIPVLGNSSEKANKTMRNVKYYFERGEVAPLLEKKWRNNFEKQMTVFEPGKIRKKIRGTAGYTQDDLEVSRANEVPRQLFYQKLEIMMDAIELTTSGMERASGNPESSHLLRAIYLATMLDMPDQGAYTAGGHEFGEYVQNGKPLLVPYQGTVKEFSTLATAYAFVEWMWGEGG